MKSDTDAVIGTIRNMYEHFPMLRTALMDPAKRRTMHDVLLPLVGAGTRHTREQCIDRLMSEGLFVSRTPPTLGRSRGDGGPRRAVDESQARFSAESQKGRLLMVYLAAGDEGMTAVEAARAAGISEKSCYWKRVSELRSGGLLANVEGPYDDVVRRPGETGAMRDVYVITASGEAKAASLER